VQINGKLRSQIEIDSDASEDDIQKAALADEKIQTHLDGREPKKVIVIKGKLINFVI